MRDSSKTGRIEALANSIVAAYAARNPILTEDATQVMADVRSALERIDETEEAASSEPIQRLAIPDLAPARRRFGPNPSARPGPLGVAAVKGVPRPMGA